MALAANAAGDARRDVRIRVRVSLEGARLIVEVDDDRREGGPTSEEEAALAALRRRVSVLYGQRAELTFATLAPRGSSAKIVIGDPGRL